MGQQGSFIAQVTRVLRSDPREDMDRFAAWWLKSRRSRPWLWDVIDMIWATATTVVVWLVVGRVAGIVFAGFWGLLMAFGWLSRFGGWKAGRRGGPPGPS